MLGRNRKKVEEKILDVDASMQGTMSFKDPVNLQINGRFEGTLDTKGVLSIGEKAFVNANIVGDEITVSGRITGEVMAKKSLKLISSARIDGNIKTPLLSIEEGAILNGNCHMTSGVKSARHMAPEFISAEEAARYLDVEVLLVNEWAASGKLPVIKDGDRFHFDRAKIDEWIASERVK
ncbi:MAG: polymer-forming cytoskeletal protein [Candidatus Omnitrophota bacterium]